MASYGVFIGLCGYQYHGPKAHVGFAPRITPEDLRAAFTAAEGWGTFSQKRAGKTQTDRIEVKWGTLRLSTLAFELPEGVKLDRLRLSTSAKDNPIQARAEQDGCKVLVTLNAPAVIEQGQTLLVNMTF
jgi:hypothetical protein